MALDQSVVDAVTNSNFKAVAEQVAFFTNQGMADAVQDQRNSRLISGAVMGALAKRIAETDLVDAVSNQLNATAALPNREVELGSSAALAQTFQVALASIAQILAKLAQSTPPETAVPSK